MSSAPYDELIMDVEETKDDGEYENMAGISGTCTSCPYDSFNEQPAQPQADLQRRHEFRASSPVCDEPLRDGRHVAGGLLDPSNRKSRVVEHLFERM